MWTPAIGIGRFRAIADMARLATPFTPHLECSHDGILDGSPDCVLVERVLIDSVLIDSVLIEQVLIEELDGVLRRLDRVIYHFSKAISGVRQFRGFKVRPPACPGISVPNPSARPTRTEWERNGALERNGPESRSRIARGNDLLP